MIKTNIAILGELRNALVEKISKKELYVLKLGAFTKSKKLPLEKVFYIIIHLIKRKLSLELYEFNELENGNSISVTASAFSQARHHLSEQLFVDMIQDGLDSFYTNNENGVKKWKGLYLEAVDGSSVNLPNNEVVKDHFGTHKNQHKSVPMGRVHMRYDVLNNLSISSKLAPWSISEGKLAREEIALIRDDSLSIYDRGYASFALFYLHNFYKKEYVCRVKLSFNNVVKVFVASGKTSEVVEFEASSDAVKTLKNYKIDIGRKDKLLVRLIRVILEDGSIEILATSLLDEEAYPSEEFKALYNYRWGVETHFDTLKNKLQLEIFSGRSVLSIQQDFYAVIFVANLHSLLIEQAQKIANERTKHRQGYYKVNKNHALGLLKRKIVQLFIAPHFGELLSQLQYEFSKELVLFSTNKNRARKKVRRSIRGKYVTHPNYRRAI